MSADPAPLFDIDAERALIGAALVAPAVLEDPQLAGLAPGAFHDARHRAAWRVLQAMAKEGAEIDNITVFDRLPADAGLTPADLTGLVIACPSSAHAPGYAKLVARLAGQRRLLDTAGDIARLAHKPGGTDPFADAAALIEAAAAGRPVVARDQMTADALFTKEFEGSRWVVEGMVRAGGKTVISGDPETGKSWLALSLALAMQSGQSWCGREVSPGPVVVWSGDMSAELQQERLRALCVGMEIAVPTAGLLFDFSTLRLDDAGDVAALRRTVKGTGARLFVVDSLYGALGALDENSSGDMGRALAGVQEIIRGSTECAALILHHPPKAKQFSGPLRGSGVLWASVDTAYVTEAVGPRDARGRILSRFKNRFEPDGRPDISFEITPKDGGIVLTAGAATREARSDTFAEAAASVMLEGLRRHTDAGNPWARANLADHARENGVTVKERTLQKAYQTLALVPGVRTAKEGQRLTYWWEEAP